MHVPWFLRADWRGETPEEMRDRRELKRERSKAAIKAFLTTALLLAVLRLLAALVQ